MKLVTAKLTSGFGNRLFQMAAAAWYAEAHERQLVFVDRFVGHAPHDAETNNYLKKVIKADTVNNYKSITILQESQINRASESELVVLDGYFQNAAYAVSIKKYIFEYLDHLSESQEAQISTFVHVRLGDYERNFLNSFKLDKNDYYMKAMSMKHLEPFEIISNDPEKATKRLKHILEQVPHTVMPIMSMSDTFERFIMSSNAVIDNSTFSWWASQFMQWRLVRQGLDKGLIVCPNPWNRLKILMNTAGLVDGRIKAPQIVETTSNAQILKYSTYLGPNAIEFLSILAFILIIFAYRKVIQIFYG